MAKKNKTVSLKATILPRNHGKSQFRKLITEELVFPQYWERYGLPTDNAELSARRAWNFGVLQTQRIYLPVVQENERLKIKITQLKARLDTNRAQVNAMAAEKRAEHRENMDICEWTQSEEDVWESACGNAWLFEDGTPEENSMKFCPFCGRKLTPRALDEANEPHCVCGKLLNRHNGVACLPETPRR